MWERGPPSTPLVPKRMSPSWGTRGTSPPQPPTHGGAGDPPQPLGARPARWSLCPHGARLPGWPLGARLSLGTRGQSWGAGTPLQGGGGSAPAPRVFKGGVWGVATHLGTLLALPALAPRRSHGSLGEGTGTAGAAAVTRHPTLSPHPMSPSPFPDSPSGLGGPGDPAPLMLLGDPEMIPVGIWGEGTRGQSQSWDKGTVPQPGPGDTWRGGKEAARLSHSPPAGNVTPPHILQPQHPQLSHSPANRGPHCHPSLQRRRPAPVTQGTVSTPPLYPPGPPPGCRVTEKHWGENRGVSAPPDPIATPG